jgi:hypothetical protein
MLSPGIIKVPSLLHLYSLFIYPSFLKLVGSAITGNLHISNITRIAVIEKSSNHSSIFPDTTAHISMKISCLE